LRGVADASPIISLSAIGKFAALTEIFADLSVAPAVFHEVCEQGTSRPGSRELRRAVSSGVVRVCRPENIVAVQAFAAILGAGERETIVVAQETEGEFVVMDDRRGRIEAMRMGFAVIGSLGVLKAARDIGFFPESLEEILTQLMRSGFRVSEAVAAAFLRQEV